jgi:hypothetical protein
MSVRIESKTGPFRRGPRSRRTTSPVVKVISIWNSSSGFTLEIRTNDILCSPSLSLVALSGQVEHPAVRIPSSPGVLLDAGPPTPEPMPTPAAVFHPEAPQASRSRSVLRVLRKRRENVLVDGHCSRNVWQSRRIERLPASHSIVPSCWIARRTSFAGPTVRA